MSPRSEVDNTLNQSKSLTKRAKEDVAFQKKYEGL